jgi:hypothetical protein
MRRPGTTGSGATPASAKSARGSTAIAGGHIVSLVLFFALFGVGPLAALALIHYLGDDLASLRAQQCAGAEKALP